MKSHRDYEPFEMAENMEEDLGLFEAATHGRLQELALPKAKSILRVIDRSNQDSTTKLVSDELQRRLECRVHEFSSTVGGSEILAEANQAAAELIVLPVPCGEDISSLQSQSLGSITDSLLQTSKLPLLCIRDPLDATAVAKLFDTMMIALAQPDRASFSAMSWAMKLMADRGKMLLLEWADRDSLAEAMQLVGDRKEDRSVEQAIVERAVTSRLGGLVGAAQRQGKKQHVNLRVECRAGNPVKETLKETEKWGDGLVVIARPEDHTSVGYHVAEDLLLATRRAVLIV